MIIHKVEAGESLLSIAAKYRISACKLADDNGIVGDRLTEGEELLILTPTRQAQIKGGDTLSKVALRFGVRKNSLLSNNPWLLGEDSLIPGKMLTVKYSPPPLGPSSALGLVDGGCPIDRLKMAIPYLTYAASFEFSLRSDGIFRTARLSKHNALIQKKDRILLAGVEDLTGGKFLEFGGYDEIISSLIKAADSAGAKGVYFKSSVKEEKEEKLAEFLLQARRKFIGLDLILFTECKCFTDSLICDASDGAVICPLSFDKCSIERAFLDFATHADSGKAFCKLDCCANINGMSADIEDAKAIARRGARAVKLSDATMRLSYRYNKFSPLGKEEVEVSYPSLELIKSAFDTGSRLGYLGFAFDVGKAPIAYFCMFNTLFSRAEYSIISVD